MDGCTSFIHTVFGFIGTVIAILGTGYFVFFVLVPEYINLPSDNIDVAKDWPLIVFCIIVFAFFIVFVIGRKD
jgi:hypothetical protein